MDADLVIGAPEPLAAFNRAGVVGASAVHAATRIATLARSVLDTEVAPEVVLTLALAVAGLHAGSVTLDPRTAAETVFTAEEEVLETSDLPWPDPETWLAALEASPLVRCGAGPSDPPGADAPVLPTPLRLVDGLVYLERYWEQEETVRRHLLARAGGESAAAPTDGGAVVTDPRLSAVLDRLFDGRGLAEGEPDRQREAAARAATDRLTVLAGGPGTGKTTTVARMLVAQQALSPHPLRIALAAPTGKAAARLEQAVRDALASLKDLGATVQAPPATTIHRLLGARGLTGEFVHSARNPLPHDVIVVDEMSMVSLSLTALLTDAARPEAHLVLVGDPDQLTSVEAGAVLADITRARPPAGASTLPGVVHLTHTWRFGGGIGALAEAVRRGDADAVLDVLRAGHDDVGFVETTASGPTPRDLVATRERVRAAGLRRHEAARRGDALTALAALDEHRLVCAHRRGPFGVQRWSHEVERWLAGVLPTEPRGHSLGERGHWAVGRPVLVTENKPSSGLSNGDTGVCVALTRPGSEPELRVAFARGSRVSWHTTLELDQVETLHAMTVHKSQGSQFEALTLVLPPADSPLLTREMFYTAVTRASGHVEVIGTEDAVRRAIARPALRASGLRDRLWADQTAGRVPVSHPETR